MMLSEIALGTSLWRSYYRIQFLLPNIESSNVGGDRNQSINGEGWSFARGAQLTLENLALERRGRGLVLVEVRAPKRPSLEASDTKSSSLGPLMSVPLLASQPDPEARNLLRGS